MLLRQWYPLAATWLMMSIEGPFLAAIIARLAEPKPNLAAFGVAFATALLLEAPVIMMLSASTALVEDRDSFRRLRRFAYLLSAAVTLGLVLLVATPLWTLFARRAIGLSPEVAGLTRLAVALLLPWPAAIGYRRFYQGLLIRGGRTGRVAYGTILRLTTMSLTALLLYTAGVAGALVGAAALSCGVLAEAVASRWMARWTVADLLLEPRGAAPPLTYGRIAAFYWPLATTSLIGLALHPIVTFFLGHARDPLESLAVMPVVHSLSFVFRSVGLSYQEVAIARLSDAEYDASQVLGFAVWLALGASFGLTLIAFTPLSELYFVRLSGLSEELAGFAMGPTRILAVLPALSVLLSMQRAVLVHGRRTSPITAATLLEVGTVVVALSLAIRHGSWPGVSAAALALIFGRIASNLYLTPPCYTILRKTK
ncbi:MAG: hypothetical protein GY716_18555 [bacterium]|nr:hypothetical protein [bacterium]